LSVEPIYADPRPSSIVLPEVAAGRMRPRDCKIHSLRHAAFPQAVLVAHIRREYRRRPRVQARSVNDI
jgi:hypothetical protein